MSKHFSDEQAKSILARAIDLDSRALTTVEDLRAIASEIGVSPQSLEAALQEHAAALETRRNAAGNHASAVVAALGVPMGVASGVFMTTAGPFASLAALAMMGVALIGSGALVMLPGVTGTLRSFHLKNLALWGGVFAGSTASVVVLGGSAVTIPALIALGWCLRGWVASSIMGSAAVIAVRRARPGDSDPDSSTDSSVREGGRWTRIASKVARWLTRPFRRHSERVTDAKRELSCA